MKSNHKVRVKLVVQMQAERKAAHKYRTERWQKKTEKSDDTTLSNLIPPQQD